MPCGRSPAGRRSGLERGQAAWWAKKVNPRRRCRRGVGEEALWLAGDLRAEMENKSTGETALRLRSSARVRHSRQLRDFLVAAPPSSPPVALVSRACRCFFRYVLYYLSRATLLTLSLSHFVHTSPLRHCPPPRPPLRVWPLWLLPLTETLHRLEQIAANHTERKQDPLTSHLPSSTPCDWSELLPIDLRARQRPSETARHFSCRDILASDTDIAVCVKRPETSQACLRASSRACGHPVSAPETRG